MIARWTWGLQPDPGFSELSEEAGWEAPRFSPARCDSALSPGQVSMSAVLPNPDLQFEPKGPQTKKTAKSEASCSQSPAGPLAPHHSLAS